MDQAACLYMGLALVKQGLMHVRKMSSHISLRNLHRLIRDDSSRENCIVAKK